MCQPLGTVIWACRKLGSLLHQNVVVLGQGPMGLMFTHMMSNLGAKSVIAVDLLKYRLEASQRMRATHIINASTESLVERVTEITEGKMADLVVEVVGHQTDTINQCLDLVRRDGTGRECLRQFQVRGLFPAKCSLNWICNTRCTK